MKMLDRLMKKQFLRLQNVDFSPFFTTPVFNNMVSVLLTPGVKCLAILTPLSNLGETTYHHPTSNMKTKNVLPSHLTQTFTESIPLLKRLEGRQYDDLVTDNCALIFCKRRFFLGLLCIDVIRREFIDTVQSFLVFTVIV
jgi:hypothetical protein